MIETSLTDRCAPLFSKGESPLSRFAILAASLIAASLVRETMAQPAAPVRVPLVRVVDLDVGERRSVELADGTTADVKLIAVDEVRDSIRDAVRRAQVKLELNGRPIELTSATYHLPTNVGSVQIDCPITRGYLTNTTEDHWGLVKAARLRLWPAGSSWVAPGTFVYPVRQRWFASATQMANEPTYVDGFEQPSRRRIYYHSGLDIGGAEGLVDVIAAVAGKVISSGKDVFDRVRRHAGQAPVRRGLCAR